MTAATLTLTDFLLARIAEDEAAIRTALDLGEEPWALDPERMLADCEAHRLIVEQLKRHERLKKANAEKHAEASHGGIENQAQITALRTHGWELTGRLEALRMAADALAAVYADHPDYRDEWRP